MPRPGVIKLCLGVALFTRKLVVVRVVVDYLQLATEGVVIRFCLDGSGGVGYHRSRGPVVGEVIQNGISRKVSSGNALALEKHILRLERTGEITLSDDS